MTLKKTYYSNILLTLRKSMRKNYVHLRSHCLQLISILSLAYLLVFLAINSPQASQQHDAQNQSPSGTSYKISNENVLTVKKPRVKAVEFLLRL